MDANERLWRAQGFEQDIWDRAVQFRDNYARLRFDQRSAFRVRYAFYADSVPDDLTLALERPELYQCTVNGQPADFTSGQRWLDDEIVRVPITAFTKVGHNVIELAAPRFDVLCEIDRVYLLGNLGLRPAETGFALRGALPAPRPGDWTKQGMPFYRGSVHYRYRVRVPEGARRWRIRAPQYEGALALITCDGQALGHVAFAPYEVDAPCPPAGEHEVAIEVVGDLRNLLGPYFGGDRPSQYWAWRAAPEHAPAGKDYRPIPQGLLADPVIEILD